MTEYDKEWALYQLQWIKEQIEQGKLDEFEIGMVGASHYEAYKFTPVGASNEAKDHPA